MKFAMLFSLALAAPMTARAQLTLVYGAAQTPVGPAFNFGNVSCSATASFQLLNGGTAPVTVNTITVTGAGAFTISGIGASLPYSIAPGYSLQLGVTFNANGAATGSYSTNLAIATTGVPIGVSLSATAVSAALTLSSNGTAVGSTYTFPNAVSGVADPVSFQLLNTACSTVTGTISAEGVGFSVAGGGGYSVGPGSSVSFTVSFEASMLANYSASLQITTQATASINVFLLATVVSAPAVTPISPCSLTTANGIAFGTLTNGSLHLCNILVTNQSAQPMVIQNISITGSFQISGPPATPLTLAPNSGPGTSLVIEVTPSCGGGSLSGTLILTTASTSFRYTITGQGVDPPLPTPSLALDASSIGSGQQHSLTISLASPAVCAASGNVNLAFQPASGLPVTDDTSIAFLSGSTRSLQFSASPGSTNVTIAGQSSATFQTGTTAGTITLSTSGIPTASQPISFAIAPAPITIETAAASNQIAGTLDIEIVGFDNTYSAGPMTFTFYDATNTVIGSAVTANFASNFQSYFAKYTSGSTFLARISFQVQGNAALVATVAATLSNNAGPVQTGTLTFQ